ncbi:LysR family transcriptional regulator [Altererythrobacter sp.]|uniref:LysR family transcriptional regulator n=1 Tax=Altererythrobacter sp. TaxID=1872480 RepID=UPI001B0F4671|nr:LysR family transcriptional regulator [Altererythrobacter sp.]MBO6608731.1 LysR family transcriptional regulator [Altererythrobacter sp.]MBO6642986.1 LysR family transcriptional regulator [Altererythrobacter sp.]MBO6709729.1 LysR family transcriptional regulator [Altererythrobacter sp.]
MKRTHLPLNALRVYDAAARHLSFTRAADELAVTPAAVGQQIRALEDHLGVVLFRRTSKGLELTGEGSAGLDALREGFLKFEESVQAMQAGQASDRYTIAVPREFYAQWLGAKLAEFKSGNPNIQFHIVADENADFTEANLDLAVRLVDGPGELEGVQLAEAQRVVVAAPKAQDSWISWPGVALPDGEKACVTTGNPGQALSSAISGLGKAILPYPLVKEAVSAGKLKILEGPDPGRRAYWLVAPLPQWRQKKVKALVARLTAE